MSFLLHEKMVRKLFVTFQILILINKGEISHCAMEDSGEQHLDPMLKLASPRISHVNILHSSTGGTTKGRKILSGIRAGQGKGRRKFFCNVL